MLQYHITLEEQDTTAISVQTVRRYEETSSIENMILVEIMFLEKIYLNLLIGSYENSVSHKQIVYTYLNCSIQQLLTL